MPLSDHAMHRKEPYQAGETNIYLNLVDTTHTRSTIFSIYYESMLMLILILSFNY